MGNSLIFMYSLSASPSFSSFLLQIKIKQNKSLAAKSAFYSFDFVTERPISTFRLQKTQPRFAWQRVDGTGELRASLRKQIASDEDSGQTETSSEECELDRREGKKD
eukprot:TRINITY_DN4439_c0_g1_i4.p1 TRINITY_DN4439_c0_g1~~TRINITY_DN4439_c0_g1_i4.p1  ORF type:complete len:107 (+),score=8.15 TRINITY_DN4439_c0_g1_i4:111-431(+)